MKIGRYEYELKKGDKFLDNGACVQLITQSKEKVEWGHAATPKLSKAAIKKLNKMPNIKKYKSTRYTGCFIYEVTETQDEL